MNEFKNKMKTAAVGLVTTVLLAVGIGLGVMELSTPNIAAAQPVAGGAGYYTPLIVVNSKTAPGTNSHFGLTTNGYYPTRLQGVDIVTNFAAKADISMWKDVSIQFTGAADVSIGAVAGQTVVATIYRSVSGESATNQVGTGINFDTLGTITLPCTTSTAGPWTVISNYCNQVSPIAGVTTLYVGKIDATGLTNGVSFTNYSVRINGK
jgi:hypothetical protein